MEQSYHVIANFGGIEPHSVSRYPSPPYFVEGGGLPRLVENIGKRFGRLTIIDLLRSQNAQGRHLYLAECECGEIVERTIGSLTRVKTPSCGCYNRDRIAQYALSREKPDITGVRFGYLLVLGKGKMQAKSGKTSSRQLWECLCDCGNKIQIERGSLELKGQVSCGCYAKNIMKRGLNPTDITGQRFGDLQPITLTGKKNKFNRPTWLLQCDCGNKIELDLRTLNHKIKSNLWVNCGDKKKHPEIGLHYPPSPIPYPKQAGELLIKYLHLTELHYPQINSAVEDEKRDRLIRACWILTYRRQQGEVISELHEKRFIFKHLRYAAIDVFWLKKLENNGGLLYTNFDKKKEIGIDMTDVTCLDYPEINLEGTILLSSQPTPKRFKFKRA